LQACGCRSYCHRAYGLKGEKIAPRRVGDTSMDIRRLIAAGIGLGLYPLPALAQAAARAAAPATNEAALGGGLSIGLIIAILAVGLAIFLIADDADEPDSP